jgi:hypothetical protein
MYSDADVQNSGTCVLICKVSVFSPEYKVAQISQKSTSHLKISGTRRVTRSKSHIEHTETITASVKNLLVRLSRHDRMANQLQLEKLTIEKLVFAQLFKKFFALYKTRSFFVVVTKTCHWSLS